MGRVIPVKQTRDVSQVIRPARFHTFLFRHFQKHRSPVFGGAYRTCEHAKSGVRHNNGQTEWEVRWSEWDYYG